MALLQHSLIYGLILSGGLIVIMIVSYAWKPAIWADDYPPDIRARVGPLDERGKRQKLVVAVPFFIFIIAVLAAAVRGLPASLTPNFATVFVTGFLVVLVFNLVDLIVLDWLYFIVWQPRWLILPGTQGLAGYRDLGFHVRGFFKGLGFCLVAALLTAGIHALLVWLA
ncbi:MAG: hypothetical protein IT317_20710 [Anaerolineales bacterium]|nr:hypothetical protein [Anaerolineales bacterium]